MCCINAISAVNNDLVTKDMYKSNYSFSCDNGQIEIVNESVMNSYDKLGAFDGENHVLKEITHNITNFTSLQEEIDNSEDGDTIYLTNNVIQDGNSPISISKSIIIVGNGYAIDGNNKSAIFVIDQGTVLLSDIAFVNDNGQSGGAILNFDDLILTRCNFTNNSASSDGGAIHNHDYLIINDCYFTNNSGKSGGAIANRGELDIINGMFYNNFADEGGAIFNSVEFTFTLSNSIFRNNSAKRLGGAISSYGYSSIDYSDFINNSASSAGAIYNRLCKMEGKYLIFSDNSAEIDGGAVYNSAGAYFTGSYLDFINNSAGTYGGAIHNIGVGDDDKKSWVVVHNLNFVENSAKYGGAINNMGLFEIPYVGSIVNQFSKNTATSYGGAVYNSNNGDLVLIGSNLTQNSGCENESIYNLGYLDYFVNNDSNYIYNMNNIGNTLYARCIDGTEILNYELEELHPFATLHDENGNAYYDSRFKICINGIEYKTIFDKDTKSYVANFTPPTYGTYDVSTSYFSLKLIIKGGKYLIFEKGSFNDLQYLINSGEILNLTYDFSYDFENGLDRFPNGVIIDKAIIINGNGHSISGSNLNRIFEISADVVLNNVTLVNGSADDLAGAAYIKNGCVTLSNCNLINNSAGGAGAIYFNSSNILKIINSTFMNNHVNGDFTFGGAIYINAGNLTVDDSLFMENYGFNGAAICNLGAMTLTNCNFTKNSGEYGLIFNMNNYSSIIRNSTFMDNQGIMSGVINNVGGNIFIDNSQFRDNIGLKSDGVISNQLYANITILNSNFTNNRAVYGGAVYNERNAEARIINSTFINNTGKENEAICSYGILYLENNFISNIIYIDKTTVEPDILSKVYLNLINGDNIIYDLDKSIINHFAMLSDDNGNSIYDKRFSICVNGEKLDTIFNSTTKMYEAVFNHNCYGEFNVTAPDGYSLKNLTAKNYKYFIVKKGSFYELKAIIHFCDGILELPYNFAYDLECDGDKFPNGIEINKNIAIEGNGHVIDGNNSYRIFYINSGNVSLNNIDFINGAAESGGALYNNGNLSLSNSNFINNTAKSDDSIFNENTLFLRNNNVSNSICNFGNITSKVYAEFIEGKSIYTYLGEIIYPFAKVTDEDGNIINDLNFNIYINDVKFETAFNKATKMLNTTFVPVNSGKYSLSTREFNASIISGEYVAIKKGSYTDLNNLINWSDQILRLEYDFAYDLECDGDKFPNGVVIDKFIHIDGQGHVLSGNNSHRIFYINVKDCILFNMTLVDGSEASGGAIYNFMGNVSIFNSLFANNTAVLGGAIDNYCGDVFIETSEFKYNFASIFGGAIDNILGEMHISDCEFEYNSAESYGDGIYNNLGNLTLRNSIFTQAVGMTNIEIFNGGSLNLENNNISTIISNIDSITSTVNAILINGENITGYVNENVCLFANLTDDNGNTIRDLRFEITTNGSEIRTGYDPTTKLYTATFIPVNSGDYIINTSYKSDKLVITPGKYTAIEKSSVPLTSRFNDIVINDNFDVFMVLKDENNNPISQVPIKYSINNISGYTSTLNDGSIKIKGKNGAVVTAIYGGNDIINGTNITVILNSSDFPPDVKVESHFNISGGTITLKGYAVDTKAGEKGMTYATELLDVNGNPIWGVKIQFALNDKMYDRTTNEKGSFTPYHLDMVRAGRYTMAFFFNGNDNYTSTFASVCIDLDKKPITIKASAKSYKAATKTKSYTVTLSTKVCSSADGKAHLSSGKKVTLVIKGKTYSGKTNAKGQVTFKITNLSKRGTYKTVISYAGDATYKSATKTVKLTIK